MINKRIFIGNNGRKFVFYNPAENKTYYAYGQRDINNRNLGLITACSSGGAAVGRHLDNYAKDDPIKINFTGSLMLISAIIGIIIVYFTVKWILKNYRTADNAYEGDKALLDDTLRKNYIMQRYGKNGRFLKKALYKLLFLDLFLIFLIIVFFFISANFMITHFHQPISLIFFLINYACLIIFAILAGIYPKMRMMRTVIVMYNLTNKEQQDYEPWNRIVLAFTAAIFCISLFYFVKAVPHSMQRAGENVKQERIVAQKRTQAKKAAAAKKKQRKNTKNELNRISCMITSYILQTQKGSSEVEVLKYEVSENHHSYEISGMIDNEGTFTYDVLDLHAQDLDLSELIINGQEVKEDETKFKPAALTDQSACAIDPQIAITQGDF